MALSCYIDYIGLTICSGGQAPASGLYINSLPGIHLESIEKIANQEQVSYLGVWADVQTSAIGQFKIDVFAELKKCYSLNTECDLEALICDNIEIAAIAWKYCLGVWLMHYRIYSNRLNRYTTVDLEQAKELLAFYQLEYEKALSQAVLLFDVSDCELCCNTNPLVVVTLP